ncbi:unnamed protein product (macronuclear) [Paramecium tetraurelia]|uniref:Uncharacterized protein n=1 Tax=Paramecium tetraurelia TaxID=5888 RepID=A0C6H3_PARTE|nr:uncharacterized protein GSPATT00035519001 [Paramecium tetraurelia]CAK66390.1 unnamed protein product [Paramecium tetraurelia]|eukprot:XP_001433787.1 hypothetical protein (macronuclear) [Paramecium tetraurelia strain d4-2]
MKNQSPSSSQIIQALALMDTYNLVLNERKRTRRNTNFQINKTKAIEQSVKIRRKSCHCQLCGDLSSFQFDTMNIPYRKQKKSAEKVEPQIQETPSQTTQRRSIFYRLQSLKSLENNQARLSLEIHGFSKNYQRQNTVQQFIAESQERSRKGSINRSGFVNTSTSENHSVKSLNIKNFNDSSPTSTKSPLIEMTTSSRTLKSSKKLLMMNTYFSQSARSLKTTQFSQIHKSRALILPKLIQNEKLN